MSLIVTVGVPGSGKSTWADRLPADILRLERDRFREAIFGSRQAYHDHAFDHPLKSKVVTEAMVSAMRNWPVAKAVVSDTNIRYRAVRPFLDLAHDSRVPVELKVFAVGEETLRERHDRKLARAAQVGNPTPKKK